MVNKVNKEQKERVIGEQMSLKPKHQCVFGTLRAFEGDMLGKAKEEAVEGN